MDETPFSVDFSSNEGSAGGYWTKPEYRGKRLAQYVTRERQRYMREHGIEVTKGSIDKRNIASQGVSRSALSNVHAEGRHLKILWWESWKETPIDSAE